jgi:TolB-like protein/class 3 adenylate cyclase/Flp pilus assembly protein TadD
VAAPRAERRLAAILAADVVGYSRLVERDETGTLERLKGHRKAFIEPLLAEHRGRIVKLMGDGALCEFASVVDAVACAIAIQRGMAERDQDVPEEDRIRFRIGINLGDVVLEEDGDLYGDGVNVAARLEQLAEPGGITLSGTAYDHLQGRLSCGLEFLGDQRFKNIERPVRVYRVALDGSRPVSLPTRWLRRGGRRLAAIAAAILLLLAGAGVGSWWWYQSPIVAEASGPPLPDKPSVAVLPFDNLSGDERLDRLADGMVEDIIANLSRFRELFVIARNSSFVYKGKPHDVRQVGRELGVKYVLEGSVQSAGDRLRVTAQLVDAGTGGHVWSERYDRPLEDFFAVRDELTATIAATLGSSGGRIATTEIAGVHRKEPESLEAYDYSLLSTYHLRRHTKEDNAKALEFARKAVALDPASARAHLEMAWIYYVEVDFAWNLPWREAMDGWRDAAHRAVALDPSDAMAHVCLGRYYSYVGDYDRQRAELETALQLEPNNPDVLINAGRDLSWLEPPGRAVALVERAFRLNPHPPASYYTHAKHPYYYARQFEKAIAVIKAKGDQPHGGDLNVLAMSYAQLGRDDEARQAATLSRQLEDWSAERELGATREFAPAAAANRALFLDGWRKAGLQLCATAEQLAEDQGIERLPECEAERARAATAKS